MTILTYVCKTKEGKEIEVKTFDEAEKIRAEGGTYRRKYTRIKNVI